jgi:hypothetical protein
MGWRECCATEAMTTTQHGRKFPKWWCFCFLGLLPLCLTAQAEDSVWQWSVPTAEGRAFLWVPEACERVRAVIVGQHNMSEERVFEHPSMRREFTQLGIAEVWIVPNSEPVFDFAQGAGERFEEILNNLAAESGYAELASAPVIPIGHSACASYPWNFAAWKPQRTLAAISLHGDAPLTNMTGSGRPNPDWGDRTLDGVPGLMLMAEYEWLEGRLAPALVYRAAHPAAPLAMLAEPGTGHFDVSEDAISFLAMFIRKAVHYRLPQKTAMDHAPELRPIAPSEGWLVQRWHLNQKRTVSPAPAKDYGGDPAEAFWCFDEEMALATQNFRSDQIGKRPQLLGWVQDGVVLPQGATHNQVALRNHSNDDGITFRLDATFLKSVDGGSSNTTRWTGLAAGKAIGHAAGGGAITLSRITGPVVQVTANTFRVQLNRTFSTSDRRNCEGWLLASHPGDALYKSAVQQALLKITPQLEGQSQRITFPGIPDQRVGMGELPLKATSDAAVTVSYYVREGPAVIEGNKLRILPLPPRAKFPVKVTVVAWQWGRDAEPKLRTAAPVEQTFLILR